MQTSAALGGEFWSRPGMTYLRDLALHYDWSAGQFVERKTPVGRLHAGTTPVVITNVRMPGAQDTLEDIQAAAASDSKVLNDAFAGRDALIGRTFVWGAIALDKYAARLRAFRRLAVAEKVAEAER